ncbi:Retrovirus-related Pol polyprotein from transposon TNT 1-94 [Cucumis melo var. makuwa]|uniref:Retrovirus-related Pol polyprotein from transposon TNT 1-94 n=1 Tax=Cucumis melo var. makuwa TaxID=1194695 RepID=A0A5A7UQA6_CUCMM|nr:Retrovirus-related Pol polyprotein from transposon TNT 1-94 [Cucumis melo var. makuwa]TYK29036.1 Retrovirus-related Pol polyprotein from transposon TNT 1-94 [Cucumis melo var. makuwa]
MMVQRWPVYSGLEALLELDLSNSYPSRYFVFYWCDFQVYAMSFKGSFRSSKTDSDWASSLDDRRSVSTNVLTLGSEVITWSSKIQATVALSSSEAEYAVATSAACQAIWLRRMLTELQHEQEGATVIFCDSKATISMTKNPPFHSRKSTLTFTFILFVAKEEVSLSYCSTHEQCTDILTKVLSNEKLCYFRAMMGISKFESRGNIED